MIKIAEMVSVPLDEWVLVLAENTKLRDALETIAGCAEYEAHGIANAALLEKKP